MDKNKKDKKGIAERNSEFGIYSGKEIFEYEHSERVPIVDKILYEKDHAMLIGREKTGKSIFTLQMAMCISSGSDFLDRFEVPTALPTLYVQTEGKVQETSNRVKRMCEAVDSRPENFGFCFEPSIALDTEEGYLHLRDCIDNSIALGNIRNPNVIFVDPVYSAMRGDFNDNEAAKMFRNSLRMLADRYNAAIVMIHHEHKTRRDDKGRALKEYGGDAATGSAVFSYHIDAGYRLERSTDKCRVLTPWADRDEKLTKKLELCLIDNGPLFYTIHGDATTSYEIVKWHLNKLGQGTTRDLVRETKLSRETINQALRYYKNKGIIFRINPGHNPASFRVKEGA